MRPALAALTRRQLLVLAGTAVRLHASRQDFWNRKPPEDWDAGDKYRLSNHSPWANHIRSWDPNPLSATYFDRRGYFVGPPTADLGPRGVVTWESAQPLRYALKTPWPRDFNNCYVIGVDGIPTGNDHELIRESTFLQSRGKVKWRVRPWVARELIRNSVVLAFGFPKSASPVDASVAEVVFSSQIGRWKVETHFRPKEMLYRGELAV